MIRNDSVKKTAIRVSVITIFVNLFLAAIKLAGGLIGKSSALVSDAINSCSDVISGIIVIVGVAIANKPSDASHPYGHERFECIASVILAAMIFASGALVGYNGVKSLITGEYQNVPTPETLALIAAAVSIAVKEFMYWYTRAEAKKANSVSLRAAASDHRADAVSSLGALLGVGATLLFGMKIFDVIASVIVCVFIIKTAINIFIESIDELTDKSCSEKQTEEISEILLSIDGVLTVDNLKTRVFGNKIYVDVEIGANENLLLKEAHAIAETAHRAIENSDERIKHCMVHVNPLPADYAEEAAAERHFSEADKI